MSESDEAKARTEQVDAGEIDLTPPTPGADDGPQDDEATEPLEAEPLDAAVDYVDDGYQETADGEDIDAAPRADEED